MFAEQDSGHCTPETGRLFSQRCQVLGAQRFYFMKSISIDNKVHPPKRFVDNRIF